jgi:hypothetical protein
VRASRLRAAFVSVAALWVALFTPTAASAQTREVWRSQDSGTVFEVGAFYKTMLMGLWSQPGLVEGAEALQRLYDQAHLARPDFVPPPVVTLPSQGSSWANTGRAWGRLLFSNKIEITAGYQVDALLASDPALTRGVGLGGSVPVPGRDAASRRLVDIDRVLVDNGTLLLQQNLDLLSVKVPLARGEVVVGRQVLSWGAGRFWNPTDLLSPFAPTDVDREVRHGVDAVRYTLPLGKTSFADFLYLPQQKGWAQGGVARVQANTKGFDVSASVAKYVSSVVFGADTAGDIGPLGVHAEAAYTLGLTNLGGPESVQVGEQFLRAVVGCDWRPAKDWMVIAEYYYNGFGATDPAGYAGKMRSQRAVAGEVYGAGRHYLGLSAIRKQTDLLSLQTLVLTNLTDPSVMVIPSSEYWAAQHVLVRVGGYIPIGARPTAAAIQSLTVSDVLTSSAAYVAAVSSMGLRSEYGSAGWSVFAQLGVHF